MDKCFKFKRYHIFIDKRKTGFAATLPESR
jgi:hypothetical protein